MKSGAEYREELKKFHPVIYFRGEKITDILEHPVLQCEGKRFFLAKL